MAASGSGGRREHHSTTGHSGTRLRRTEEGPMTDAAGIRRTTSLGAVAFGVAGALAPDALARAYGTVSPTPEHVYTVRIWAGATAAFGAVGLLQDGLDDRRFLQVALALSAFDAFAGLAGRGTTRSRALTTATSVAFGAAAAK